MAIWNIVILNNTVTEVLIGSVLGAYIGLYYYLRKIHKVNILDVLLSSTCIVGFAVFLRDDLWTVFANLLYIHYTPNILIMRGIAALGLGFAFFHLRDYTKFGKITKMSLYSMIALVFLGLAGSWERDSISNYIVYALSYVCVTLLSVGPFIDKLKSGEAINVKSLSNNSSS